MRCLDLKPVTNADRYVVRLLERKKCGKLFTDFPRYYLAVERWFIGFKFL